jgi:V/A-type H+/Na+-transporting ATPase subunit K
MMAGPRQRSRWPLIAAATLPVLLLMMLVPVWAQMTGTPAPARAPAPPDVMKWGFMAAAIVAGLSAVGAAYAVAVVGGAAMGAVAEKPETAGRALVFVGLAEGIAIYGLIIAIMILGYLP